MSVHSKNKLNRKPEYSDTIKYFWENKRAFGRNEMVFESEVFIIPEVFSIIENYSETTLFLRKFFNALYNQSYESIYIDYQHCKEIDVCASMCMDIILAEFVNYYEQCTKGRHIIKIKSISPINFNGMVLKRKYS